MAEGQTPYNGGFKVVMGCDGWWSVIGECNCRLLDALQWWVQGGNGLPVVALCYWAPGIEVQNARRLLMVVLRWSWVASGCAVILRNASADCWVVVGCEWRRRAFGEW